MIIRFSKELYTLKAVEKAIKDYNSLAILEIKNNKDSIEVRANDINSDIKDIFEDEFCNYVLSEVRINSL